MNADSSYLNNSPRRLSDVLRDKMESFGYTDTPVNKLAYIALVKEWGQAIEREATEICLRVADTLEEQADVRKNLKWAISFQVDEAVWDIEQKAKEAIQLANNAAEYEHERIESGHCMAGSGVKFGRVA